MVDRSTLDEINDSLRVPDSRATLELQVLAQIRDNLSAILNEQREMRRDQRDMGKDLSETRERLIRLEERDERTSRLERSLQLLDEQVTTLQTDKDRRDGALSASAWVLRNWPSIVGMLIIITVILKATGKI